MKNIGFDKDMIKMLKNQIGRNIDCIMYEGSSGNNTSFGDLAVKIEDVLVEISNHEDMDGWDEEYDSSHFACEVIDEYIPCVNHAELKTIEINEMIKNINIIYDEIQNDYYNFNYDMGLEIITENHKYLISRDYYYSEILTISIDKDLDDIYPVSKVIDDWKDDDSIINVIVNRKIKAVE